MILNINIKKNPVMDLKIKKIKAGYPAYINEIHAAVTAAFQKNVHKFATSCRDSHPSLVAGIVANDITEFDIKGDIFSFSGQIDHYSLSDSYLETCHVQAKIKFI